MGDSISALNLPINAAYWDGVNAYPATTFPDTNTSWDYRLISGSSASPPYVPTPTTDLTKLQALIDQHAHTNPVKESKPMRGLFEVFIVEPDHDAVVHEARYIANNEENAKAKAIKATAAKLERDIDEYDFIVRKVGNVRTKKDARDQVGGLG